MDKKRIRVQDAICQAVGFLASIVHLDQNQMIQVEMKKDKWSFRPVNPTNHIFRERTFPYTDKGFLNDGDIIHFEYTNSNEGSELRVGEVLDNRGYSTLLWDYSVNGMRRFKHEFMENIHFLREIDNE